MYPALCMHMCIFCLIGSTDAVENVALGQRTWQSSVLNWAHSGLAVDGNINPNYDLQSCSHSSDESEAFPTGMVDLGRNYRLGYINITNRLSDPHRLSDFEVAVRSEGPDDVAVKGPFPEEELCHRHAGHPAGGETITVICALTAPKFARYVYVYLPGDFRKLTLCEVEIYEHGGSMMNIYKDGGACWSTIISPVATEGQAITSSLLDQNLDTCFRPSDAADTRLHMVAPTVQQKSLVHDVQISGYDLQCNPVNGMAVATLSRCQDGTCDVHDCVALKEQNGHGYMTCSYRCGSRSTGGVMITMISLYNIPTICEVRI